MPAVWDIRLNTGAEIEFRIEFREGVSPEDGRRAGAYTCATGTLSVTLVPFSTFDKFGDRLNY